MKKYIIYVGILVIGLLLGWILFGGSSNKEEEHNHNEDVAANQMWTCSMHPQIMQPEAGDCPICGMDLIPAESGSDGLLADQFKLTENAMALANIQTTIVGKNTIEEDAIKLSGRIAENEEANTVQVSYFSGRIERLNVNFTGEKVSKGQLLATIYSPELYAAQQELITAVSLKESQPVLYNAVRNKLKLWKLSDSQINQIETTGKVKENVPVYATVSGTVTEKLVEQGDYIKQGQPLLKIANLNTVWANFDVYENQISQFKKGQEVSIATNAYPNKAFKGKVDFINPVLDTKTRTVTLRVILNNKEAIFKPGMFVEGSIKRMVDSKDEMLSIPSSAVLWTGKRSVVYVKVTPEQPIFEMKEIKLGNKIGDSYEVLEGLNSGDEIVTNGTFTVDAAAQLQGKKSMMNREGEKAMIGHEGHSGMNSNRKETQRQISTRLIAPKAFQAQLNILFEDYINIEKALVEDDANTAQKSAGNLLTNIMKVNVSLLTDTKAFNHWTQLEKELKTASTFISQTTDIITQREHFIHLSAHLINAIESFGIGQKVYVDFCPMANNNVGAYWLSEKKEILNPYFGDAMLSCGSVKQVIED